MLKEIRRYLSDRPGSRLIDPWLNGEEVDWMTTLLELDSASVPLAAESKTAFVGLCQTVFDALAQVSAAGKLAITSPDGPLIVKLAVATNDAGAACNCLLQLRATKLEWLGARDHYDIDHFVSRLRLAFDLDPQARLFASLVSKLREEPESILSLLRTVDGYLAQAGWTGATAALIANGDLAPLNPLRGTPGAG